MLRIALWKQILVAIAAAIVVGWFSRGGVELFGVPVLTVYEFVGKLFITALKMLIVPLVVSSMIIGIANIGRGADGGGSLGRIGLRTIGFYTVTLFAAVLVGLVLVNLIQPGIVDGQPARELLALEATAAQAGANIKAGGLGDVVQIFARMVPENVFRAAVENEMLALIFFALLFGYFVAKLPSDLGDVQHRFWQGVFEIMMMMTDLVMTFAPVGVFALVAAVVAKTGFDAARPLFMSAVTVVLALAFHMLVTLPLFLRFVGGVDPWRFYRAVAPAMLTAFSTASSNATLPVNMDCLEKRVGVSNRITSFVLPLGATVNMNGSALYECVAALFIAQAYGLDLSFGTQFAVVIMAVVTSIGVAGVPAASLVAIAIILTAIGLPAEAIGVLFVFDRVLDMARTTVNVTGDGVAAVLVARLEGEETKVAVGSTAA
jgi:Na+/H+-dicarboxylate symporter